MTIKAYTDRSSSNNISGRYDIWVAGVGITKLPRRVEPIIQSQQQQASGPLTTTCKISDHHDPNHDDSQNNLQLDLHFLFSVLYYYSCDSVTVVVVVVVQSRLDRLLRCPSNSQFFRFVLLQHLTVSDCQSLK